jgi:hypothetical protein
MHIDKWTAFQVYALIVNSERANSDKHELKIIAFDEKTKRCIRNTKYINCLQFFYGRSILLYVL